MRTYFSRHPEFVSILAIFAAVFLIGGLTSDSSQSQAVPTLAVPPPPAATVQQLPVVRGGTSILDSDSSNPDGFRGINPPQENFVQSPTPEPNLLLRQTIYEENFDSPSDFRYWMKQFPFQVVQADTTQVLKMAGDPAFLPLTFGGIHNTSLEARVQIIKGGVVFAVHNSGYGRYEAHVSEDGSILLIRNGQLLASENIGIPEENTWIAIRLDVQDNNISLSIDDIVIANLVDPAPLPYGSVFFATGLTQSDVLIDDIVLQGYTNQETTRFVAENNIDNTVSDPQILQDAFSNDVVFSRHYYITENGAPQFKSNLYSMNADGSNVIQITFGDGVYISPMWSPQRDRIAFIWDNGLTYQLDVLWADGTRETLIDNVLWADWSRENPNWIAFNNTGDYTTYIFDIASGNTVPNIEIDGAFPAWSPTGHEIAFARWNSATNPQAYYIWIANITTGAERQIIFPPGIYPDWSPDGGLISYSRPLWGILYTIPADGSGEPDEVYSPGAGYDVSHPSWSPNGTEILFVQNGGNMLRVGRFGGNPQYLGSGSNPDWGWPLVPPTPELNLNLAIPDTVQPPYEFTIGDEIPLLANITGPGIGTVTDPVRIELTVPRGLRPNGMTITDEDPTELAYYINVLIDLLSAIDPDWGDLLNDILQITVDNQTVTYVYDIESGSLSQFEITLEVVGQVPGEFTIMGNISIVPPVGEQGQALLPVPGAENTLNVTDPDASLVVRVSLDVPYICTSQIMPSVNLRSKPVDNSTLLQNYTNVELRIYGFADGSSDTLPAAGTPTPVPNELWWAYVEVVQGAISLGRFGWVAGSVLGSDYGTLGKDVCDPPVENTVPEFGYDPITGNPIVGPTPTPTPTLTFTPTYTPTGPTHTPTITPIVTATPTDTLTLADFGITLIYDGNFWDAVKQQEEANILIGVRRIADALELLGVPGNTPQERFRSVFITSRSTENDLAITFLRLLPLDQPNPDPMYGYYYNNPDPEIILEYNCWMNDYDDGIVETGIGYVVACRGFQTTNSWNPPGGIQGYGILTPETVIHELGHALDSHTSLELRTEVNRAPLYDCRAIDEPIMRPLDAVDPRGLEGWGSLSRHNEDISQFQQNPSRSEEEITADMFLNWVYRITEEQYTYFDPSLVPGDQAYLCGYKPPNPNEAQIPRVNIGGVFIQVAHDAARTEWENANANWDGFRNDDASGNFASINYPDGTRREHLPGNARFARTHNSLYKILVEQ